MKNIDNLSAKDKMVFDSLVNPDEPHENKFHSSIEFQQSILSMLLCDKIFLISAIRLIRPNYFVDRSHETICSILFDYFSKNKTLPNKTIIKTEICERCHGDKKQLLFLGELEALTSYIPGFDSRDHCLDKITEFAKEQALRAAVSQTLDLLEKGNQDKWQKIETIFRDALLTDRSFDIGLDYFDTLEDRYDRMVKMEAGKEVFVTGFDSIDNPSKGLAAGGIGRGEIGAYVGMSGAGKSLLLVKSAVHNLLRGKKVLFISLEMDQDKVAKRFDAQLAVSDIKTLIDKRAFIIESLKEHVKGDQDKRRLVIKQFPAGMADMHTIRAYCAQLNLYDFKPDLLSVDYIGEFKDDPNVKTYESRQRIVRDLRAFGVEEDHATFTALQSNRRGREAQDQGIIDDSELGDSYGQIRPLDTCWSLNQSTQEKSMGIGRIFVVKHRDGRSRYSFPFKQDNETLDIREISWESHANLASQFAKKKGEDMQDQIQKVVGRKFRQNDE